MKTRKLESLQFQQEMILEEREDSDKVRLDMAERKGEEQARAAEGQSGRAVEGQNSPAVELEQVCAVLLVTEVPYCISSHVCMRCRSCL
jgi:hypothetical protein